MTVKRRDFQKIAALIHEFLLKLDEDVECAEVRDALNYALLQLQRYFRLLRNRNALQYQSSLGQPDRSVINGNNSISLLGPSLRGLSPMTPFKDAPDKFVWRWTDLEATSTRTGVATLPTRLDKEASTVPAVMRAARQSDNNVLAQLLERGNSNDVADFADADCVLEVDCLSRTALMYAVNYSSLDTMQLLLEHGADVNAVAEDGSTAVHRACCNGNHEALCILIQYHADISVQDVHGRAPIHWAAIAPKTECLKLLLENHVDAGVRDRDGLSPSMWACRWDRIENFDLLSSELERQSRKRSGKQQHHRQQQPASGTVDGEGFERDESGRTWMHWSVRRAEPLECLRTLLSDRAAQLADSDGKTVMHVAAEQGSLPAAKIILEIAGRQTLEQRDNNNRTPLILATMGGHGEVVNFLLSEGADLANVDNFGNTAWNYAATRQMHYCRLIIASYLRQRGKNQTNGNDYDGGGLYENGSTFRSPAHDDLGINHLQINGDDRGMNGDDRMAAAYMKNVPRPPAMPPVTPRTPRLARTNGLLSTASMGDSTLSVDIVPSTPRGGQSNKRSPTTPVDDDEVNGYVADHERNVPRVGSASKRLRAGGGAGKEVGIKSGSSVDRRSRQDTDGVDSDGYGQPEEAAMSIDVMDVSDFEGGPDVNDDMAVPPSPRPPAQPYAQQRNRRSGAAGAPQVESKAPVYVADTQPSRPSAQPRKYIPLNGSDSTQAARPPSAADRNAGTSSRLTDYYDGGGAWADYETRPNSGADSGASRDRPPSSRPPPKPKSPPPPLTQPADSRTMHPLPPSHLVPLPVGGPVKKKKKKRILASMLPSPESPTAAARSSLASPSMGNDPYGHQPSSSGSSRSRSEPSPHRESPGFRSFQPGLGRPSERPSSRSQSDQWHRDQAQFPANSDYSDEDSYVANDESRSSSRLSNLPPGAAAGSFKGSKYQGGPFSNGTASQNHSSKGDGRRTVVQSQAYDGVEAVSPAPPGGRDSRSAQRPPISPRRTLTTNRPANDVPWMQRKSTLPNGDLSQRRH